ncbi:glycosyltransferase [Candidatus Peregrinibacteria bacterium]|nr:glycosyltransferase [Candidatus Peregrinibacteria bacterium]
MKKILLVGNAPLPTDNEKIRPAAGLRTHQFVKPLQLNKGVELRVVALGMPECYNAEMTDSRVKNLKIKVISKDDKSIIAKIQDIHDEFQPDAVIGVNTYPSFLVSKLKFSAPFWADLNGWIMAEAQAQAYKMDSNDFLSHYYGMEKSIIRRADKISCVSGAQANAILGELAGGGRLNKETFGYNFLSHIPNGTEYFKSDELKEAAHLFRSIPEDAFILLWLGGYNTWVDENTLFEGIELAMNRTDNIYFVSTGGSVKGLSKNTFNNFYEKVQNSRYRKRYKFLGWLNTEDIPYVYKRAHIGLNVDKMCTETLTGARNRINEMMKFGLPVVTTLGSEISNKVEESGAGKSVESGNPRALFEAIMQIYKNWVNKDGYEEMGMRGRAYINEQCNYNKVMAPLIEWLKSAPGRAPDSQISLNLNKGKLRAALKYLKQNGLKSFLKKLLQRF